VRHRSIGPPLQVHATSRGSAYGDHYHRPCPCSGWRGCRLRRAHNARDTHGSDWCLLVAQLLTRRIATRLYFQPDRRASGLDRRQCRRLARAHHRRRRS
ncbi:MAG: hypothetical protein AVDCRST_MAG93-9295, partial [uncultured Chloroflexia bacterium]